MFHSEKIKICVEETENLFEMKVQEFFSSKPQSYIQLDNKATLLQPGLQSWVVAYFKLIFQCQSKKKYSSHFHVRQFLSADDKILKKKEVCP